MTMILQSVLTCPACGTQALETMPTDACLYFYTCAGCGIRLKPKHGDCCVFCSYGSVACPPIQEGGQASDCAAPDCCSLEPGPFRERIGEFAALMKNFDGHVHSTSDGAELRFAAAAGLRATLEELSEKERVCCATLRFTVAEQADAISLRVEGSGDDRAAIDDLAARLGAGHAVSAELRAGVQRPDWSKVALPHAREVLRRRLGAVGVARWQGLEMAEDETLTAVLRYFADHGRAPAVEDVASASGQSPDQVRRSLEMLRARDLVVFDAAGASIVAAYPFTAYVTGHRVTLRGRTVDSLCAIDALGTGAMCRSEASIISSCAYCGASIDITTSANGDELVAVEPAGTVVWYTLVFDGCAAQSCCPGTLFFCSDDHLAAWRESKGDRKDGARLSIEEAFEIGVALFEPLLRPAA
jgi:hypothetical protein